MKTITGNTSYRKQYATSCLIKSHSPNTRSFDNCFEMGDGDEVVRHVMKRATETIPLAEKAEAMVYSEGLAINSPEYKALMKKRKQDKLVANLKRGGFWNKWVEFTELNQ